MSPFPTEFTEREQPDPATAMHRRYGLHALSRAVGHEAPLYWASPSHRQPPRLACASVRGGAEPRRGSECLVA